MDGLKQLKDARKQVKKILQTFQEQRCCTDFDSLICDVSNILIDLSNESLVGSRAEYCWEHYVDEELINNWVKHYADEGDYWRIRTYLQDVSNWGANYYIQDDDCLQDVTADDLETWLMDIIDSLDGEIKRFNS